MAKTDALLKLAEAAIGELRKLAGTPHNRPCPVLSILQLAEKYEEELETARALPDETTAEPTKRIINYEVLGDTQSADLVLEVQKKLSKGWQPWGSLAVQGNGYVQAMVKWGK